MRLIDADEFCRYTDEHCQDCFADLWKELIRRQPTAFDKEKVIEELRNEIHLTVYDPMISGRYIKKERAIEIVEKGGIE